MILVNEGIVEEVLLPLGQIDFHKGQVAKCDVALWRTRGEHKPLVGEFAFQIKFERREDVHEKAKNRAEQFFISLQHAAKDWIAVFLGSAMALIVAFVMAKIWAPSMPSK